MQFVEDGFLPRPAPPSGCATDRPVDRSRHSDHARRSPDRGTLGQAPASRLPTGSDSASQPDIGRSASNQPSGERVIGTVGPSSSATLTLSCAGAHNLNRVCPLSKSLAPNCIGRTPRTAALRCALRRKRGLSLRAVRLRTSRCGAECAMEHAVPAIGIVSPSSIGFSNKVRIVATSLPQRAWHGATSTSADRYRSTPLMSLWHRPGRTRQCRRYPAPGYRCRVETAHAQHRVLTP